MWLVFSDLDGTLLDHETYSFEPARPALERLKRLNIPLVLTTSKTRAEVEVWRQRLDNHHPFIVENGGAAFVPSGTFPFELSGSEPRGDYRAIEFGDRYEALVEALHAAAVEADCAVRGFHEMTAEQVSARCNLPLEEAALAKRREYDEVFEIPSDACAARLLRAIEARGRRWTRGGRFYHIMGDSDKAAAVASLSALYRKAFGAVTVIGLGDGLNDASFLNAVDLPVLIRSGQTLALRKAVPSGRLTEQPGPEGWNRAISEMIPE